MKRKTLQLFIGLLFVCLFPVFAEGQSLAFLLKSIPQNIIPSLGKNYTSEEWVSFLEAYKEGSTSSFNLSDFNVIVLNSETIRIQVGSDVTHTLALVAESDVICLVTSVISPPISVSFLRFFDTQWNSLGDEYSLPPLSLTDLISDKQTIPPHEYDFLSETVASIPISYQLEKQHSKWCLKMTLTPDGILPIETIERLQQYLTTDRALLFSFGRKKINRIN